MNTSGLLALPNVARPSVPVTKSGCSGTQLQKCTFAMATYGEEVEILFDIHAGLRPSHSSLLMSDDLHTSEMLRSNSDPIAEIHSSTRQDLKDEHIKPSNLGLGLTLNNENRYQRYDIFGFY